MQQPEGVDLGQRHVVLQEQASQPGEDRGQTVEHAAGHPDRGDQLLGLPVREGSAGAEVRSGDMVGVLGGDLLDVDAAHVGEQHHRPLVRSVPHHPGVVLVRDVRARVHQHAAGHVAVDLELEHLGGVLGRLLRRVGELHAAGLHPPAAQHLGLDHHRTVDLGGDRARLVSRGGEPVARDRDARSRDDRA
jgi:hypothetical protein